MKGFLEWMNCVGEEFGGGDGVAGRKVGGFSSVWTFVSQTLAMRE